MRVLDELAVMWSTGAYIRKRPGTRVPELTLTDRANLAIERADRMSLPNGATTSKRVTSCSAFYGLGLR
jgi:hypothetical protein